MKRNTRQTNFQHRSAEKHYKLGSLIATEKQLKVLDNIGMLDRILEVAYKNDPASTSLASTSALQGPLQGNESLGGIFSSPGVRPQRFSAVQRPRSFARLLTPKVSEYNEEILEIMASVSAGTGTNATGFCADPPAPGQASTCKQTFF